jgi:hypothetical protein
MEKTYPSDKSNWLAKLAILFPLAMILLIVIYYESFLTRPSTLVILLNLIFPLWIYFDTSYRLEDGYFHYRFGYNRGKIEIEKIREIGPGKFSWPGQKAALATKGLQLKYNSYDDIFIAPKDRQRFITDLLQINPSIQVAFPDEERRKSL